MGEIIFAIGLFGVPLTNLQTSNMDVASSYSKQNAKFCNAKLVSRNGMDAISATIPRKTDWQKQTSIRHAIKSVFEFLAEVMKEKVLFFA